MTVLEQLAATTSPVWLEMISQRRVDTVGDGSVGQSRRAATDWGRKGESHYKDGVFTKKS